MSAKLVIFHDAARAKIINGVNVLADAVKVTLGPRGCNVILDRVYGPPIVANSGVSVAMEIELKDRFENMGAQMVKEVSSKASDVAGDGTTTITVLAQTIVREGMKFVAAGMNPMDLKRGIDHVDNVTIEELRIISRPCRTLKEIAQLGVISANSDTAVGDNQEQDAGIKIVLRALEEPLRQFVHNAGGEPSVVLSNVLAGKGGFDYNAATDQYGDLIEMGILDPTKVTRSALQNAASIASLILTTDAMIAELPKEEARPEAMNAMGDMEMM